jgi:hypothetical protein
MTFFIDLERPYYFSVSIGLPYLIQNEWFSFYVSPYRIYLSVLKICLTITNP